MIPFQESWSYNMKIKELLSECEVSQIDSKNLYKVEWRGCIVFLSYEKLIGLYNQSDDMVYLSPVKYSKTTSKHATYLSKRYQSKIVSVERLKWWLSKYNMSCLEAIL